MRPRVHRGFTYAVMRAWATVVQLDLQVASVIGDIQAGRPVVYTTFLAYDEVAHHSGIERADTLATLRQVDHAIARIAAVAAVAARPYELVVLSDHGQTQGATFLQRYGETLEALVARACGTDVDAVAASDSGEDEARGRLGAALTEASGAKGAGGRAVRAATRGRTVDGEVRMEQEADEGEGLAGDRGHGLRLPRPHQLPAPAGPRDARGHRRALAGAAPGAARASGHRLRARPPRESALATVSCPPPDLLRRSSAAARAVLTCHGPRESAG